MNPEGNNNNIKKKYIIDIVPNVTFYNNKSERKQKQILKTKIKKYMFKMSTPYKVILFWITIK